MNSPEQEKRVRSSVPGGQKLRAVGVECVYTCVPFGVNTSVSINVCWFLFPIIVQSVSFPASESGNEAMS